MERVAKSLTSLTTLTWMSIAMTLVEVEIGSLYQAGASHG